jgi:hypothetical protein
MSAFDPCLPLSRWKCAFDPFQPLEQARSTHRKLTRSSCALALSFGEEGVLSIGLGTPAARAS